MLLRASHLPTDAGAKAKKIGQKKQARPAGPLHIDGASLWIVRGAQSATHVGRTLVKTHISSRASLRPVPAPPSRRNGRQTRTNNQTAPSSRLHRLADRKPLKCPVILRRDWLTC
jgi:hypothetical protein